MSKYHFDEVIDRKNTNSLKFDFAVERNRPADVFPLWVADMDFRVADPIREGLQRTLEHGIFGYTEAKDDYFEAVAGWFLRRFGLKLSKEWLVKTPGVVFALALAVKAYTKRNDAVLVQPPVYYPFFEVIEDNGRRIVRNDLIYENGAYRIDFEDFEHKIVENDVHLFLLCSPHNPVGRVWKPEELKKMVEICKKHDVMIAADEIHCDFTYKGVTHTPLLKACPDYADHIVLCTAPSKTFNIAGLQVSNIFIPGEKPRALFKKELAASGYSQLNTFGINACTLAYNGGEEWLEELKQYLQENLDFLREYLKTNIPQIKLVEPEGTYLVWLDMSALGLGKRQLNDLVINKAKLWLDSGHIFGANYEQFQRIVIACPRKSLTYALERLEYAVNGRQSCYNTNIGKNYNKQ